MMVVQFPPVYPGAQIHVLFKHVPPLSQKHVSKEKKNRTHKDTQRHICIQLGLFNSTATSDVWRGE